MCWLIEEIKNWNFKKKIQHYSVADHESIVELLVKDGASVNAVDKSGVSPLFDATERSMNSQFELTNYLVHPLTISHLNFYKNLSIVCGNRQWYMTSCKKKTFHKWLVVQTLNFKVSLCEFFLLHIDNGKMVDLLIQLGASVNLTRIDGETPLMAAAIQGNLMLCHEFF